MLVLPTARVKRRETEITGIIDYIMEEARARGQAVGGWSQARSELWKHVDASTILVRQSLHHDLEVLGMLHTKLVDPEILAAKAVDLPSLRTFGLKQMRKEILHVDNQCIRNGMHDCLEDTLASRELVLHFTYNPEKF